MPLSSTSTMFSEPPSLQYIMVDSLNDDVRMASDPAREARFQVLGVPEVPGVLLEMGFLSNRQDEALLSV